MIQAIPHIKDIIQNITYNILYIFIFKANNPYKAEHVMPKQLILVEKIYIL